MFDDVSFRYETGAEYLLSDVRRCEWARPIARVVEPWPASRQAPGDDGPPHG